VLNRSSKPDSYPVHFILRPTLRLNSIECNSVFNNVSADDVRYKNKRKCVFGHTSLSINLSLRDS
jgi:hypothetical protein